MEFLHILSVVGGNVVVVVEKNYTTLKKLHNILLQWTS